MTRLVVLRGSLLAIVFATTGVCVPRAANDPVRREPIRRHCQSARRQDRHRCAQRAARGFREGSREATARFRFGLDKGGLRRAKVAASVPITASFKQVPLGVALRQILRPLKLQHRVADGTIIIDDIGLRSGRAHRPADARWARAECAVVEQSRESTDAISNRDLPDSTDKRHCNSCDWFCKSNSDL